ncbi:putative transcription factor bHLH47-like [Capsicum annuum]|nr:putative transcription factor bHLH47-like [Capsicum annuum]
MPDWSELPHDLLVLIATRLNLIVDYLIFGTVCNSWHSAATKNNFNSGLPWLMLAEEEDNEGNTFRRFFSLYDGTILKKRIPKASRKCCMESMDWLITVGDDEGEISLIHPFSDVHIELPHQNTTLDYDDDHSTDLMTFIRKAVLSANPSHTSDYVVMAIERNMKFISFWRPGDLRWTRVIWEGTQHNLFADLVYFNGKIYTVSHSGEVLVCDVDDFVGLGGHVIAQIPFEPQEFVEQLCWVNIRPIEDDCEIFPLTLRPDERELLGDGEFTYGTTDFRVFQVDLAAGKVTETNELRDMAFFLGANASLSVQASQFPGIKPNHIYFTDDCFESYTCYEEGGGLDMGVFNVADGSIQPHYDGVSLSWFCPPIWVTPTL